MLGFFFFKGGFKLGGRALTEVRFSRLSFPSICVVPGCFLLRMSQRMRTAGWLATRKILSLLWLAVVSPGYSCVRVWADEHASFFCMSSLPFDSGALQGDANR